MKTQKIQMGITFMMVLSLLLFMGMWAPHSARAEESRLYVGGVNANETPSGEGWSYDKAANVLTLSGANLTVTGDDSIVAVILSDKALTVKLTGENRLVPDRDDKKAIYCGGALTLTGEGSLMAQADTTKENVQIIDTDSLVMNGTGALTLVPSASAESPNESYAMQCHNGYAQHSGQVTIGSDEKRAGVGLAVIYGNCTVDGGSLSVYGNNQCVTVGGDLTIDNAAVYLDRANPHSPPETGGDAALIKQINGTRGGAHLDKSLQGVPQVNSTHADGVISIVNNADVTVRASNPVEKDNEDALCYLVGLQSPALNLSDASLKLDISGCRLGVGLMASGYMAQKPQADCYIDKGASLDIKVKTGLLAQGINTFYASIGKTGAADVSIDAQAECLQPYADAIGMAVLQNPFYNELVTGLTVENKSQLDIGAGALINADIPEPDENDAPQASTALFTTGSAAFSGASQLDLNSHVQVGSGFSIDPKARLNADGLFSAGQEGRPEFGAVTIGDSCIVNAKAVSVDKSRAPKAYAGSIYANGTLNIGDATVNATANDLGIYSYYDINISPLSRDSRVHAATTGEDGIAVLAFENSTLNIGKGNAVTTPAGGVVGRITEPWAGSTILPKGQTIAAAEVVVEKAETPEPTPTPTVKPAPTPGPTPTPHNNNTNTGLQSAGNGLYWTAGLIVAAAIIIGVVVYVRKRRQ